MARAPFVSKAARAAGVTTEQGYLNWLAQQRFGVPSYSVGRRIKRIIQTIEQPPIPSTGGWHSTEVSPGDVTRFVRQLPQDTRVQVFGYGLINGDYPGRGASWGWANVIDNRERDTVPDIIPWYQSFSRVTKARIVWKPL